MGRKHEKYPSKKCLSNTQHHYNQLPKDLLPQESAPLLHTFRDTLEEPNSFFYRHLGGWMLAEASLIETDRSADERHATLQKAREDWLTAKTLQHDKEQTKAFYQEYNVPSTNMIRVDYCLAAADIFGAMIDGDVTEDHRARYYESVLELGAQASRAVSIFKQDTPSDHRIYNVDNYLGIAHEINASLAINRLNSPTLMAFPALPRSDSGKFHPKKSHDIQLLKMKWGEINGTLAAEVKTSLQDAHYERYEAVLIGGSLHLHPQNRRTPVAMTELLVKEVGNLATQEEILQLDKITDNVIHAARHGFTGTPQCRDEASCTVIPHTRK